MRAGVDAPTLALYTSGVFDLHTRLRVQNGSGTFINLSGRYKSYRWKPPEPSTPIASLNVEFVRETTAGGVSTSLSPTVAGSSFNRLDNGTTYSPLLQLGRIVSFEVALTAVGGTRPVDGSTLWYEIFRGYITEVNWPEIAGRTASISCNDLAGILQIKKAETVFTYAAGTSIETVARAILDNHGFTWMPLYFPTATGKVLPNNYAPPVQTPVWKQLTDLATACGGWLCFLMYRNRYDYEVRIFPPARSKAVSDMTIDAYDFRALSVDETEVRNVGYLAYYDASGAHQLIGPYVNNASISKYGGTLAIRRPFWIALEPDSPIRSLGPAQDMLNAALSDVSDPDAIAAALTFPLVFAENGVDLYTFLARNELFDSNQNYAPFSLTVEEQADQEPVSVVNVRGRPTAGAKTWTDLAYLTDGDNESTADNDILSWLPSYTDPFGNVVPYAGVVGASVSYVLFWSVKLKQGAASPWLNNAIESMGVSQLLPVVDRRISYTMPVPEEKFLLYFRLRPVTVTKYGQVIIGNSIDGIVYPKSAQPPVVEEDDHETGSVGTYFIYLQERGIHITSVLMQTQVGDAQISGFSAPTRGPGELSAIPGRGVLQQGQYEGDVQQSKRLSWVVFRVQLATGDVMTLTSPAFDLNKVPTFVTQPTVNGTVISVRGDADTKSIRIYRNDAPWSQAVAGREADIDVALPDMYGQPGHGANEVASYSVNIYSDPTADVDYRTLVESAHVVVATGSAAAVALTVEVAEPTLLSDVMTIYITGDSSPGGSYLTGSWRYRVGGKWSEPASITSGTSPVLGAIPTSRTGYTFPTGLTRLGKPGPGEALLPMVEVQVSINAVNSSDEVIGSGKGLQFWYVLEH